MAAKKKVMAKVAKKSVKVKAPKKANFKAVQKRALALFADWYTRNEAQVVKYLERMEKVLAEMNEEPKGYAVPLPYPTVGDAMPAGSPVGMMGQAAPWAPGLSLVPPEAPAPALAELPFVTAAAPATAVEEPKPEAAPFAF